MKKELIDYLGSKTSIVIDKVPPEDNAVAQFIPQLNMILLDKDSHELWKDFCHELFHLICYRMGMRQTSFHADIEEMLAENFSVLMTENWNDLIKMHKKLNKQSENNIKSTKHKQK